MTNTEQTLVTKYSPFQTNVNQFYFEIYLSILATSFCPIFKGDKKKIKRTDDPSKHTMNYYVNQRVIFQMITKASDHLLLRIDSNWNIAHFFTLVRLLF